MKKTLIVIDMQNDFIDGSLGTAEAVAILDGQTITLKKLNLSAFAQISV